MYALLEVEPEINDQRTFTTGVENWGQDVGSEQGRCIDVSGQADSATLETTPCVDVWLKADH